MFGKSSSFKNTILRTAAIILVVFAVCTLFAVPAFADEEEPETVRVGYYENEVFQEGGQEGAVKTGYAYEYYRKLSEYTGWKYEYVYGSFGDLYRCFWTAISICWQDSHGRKTVPILSVILMP